MNGAELQSWSGACGSVWPRRPDTAGQERLPGAVVKTLRLEFCASAPPGRAIAQA